MLTNVVDLRENPYRWGKVLAVVQSTAKDNGAENADQAPEGIGIEIDYAEREGLSVNEAVIWANRMDGMVTLYLYDDDGEGERASEE